MHKSITPFMFDTSFDPDDPDDVREEDNENEEDLYEEPEVIVPTFSEEELEDARQEAFVAGKEEGLREAAASIEQAVASSLTTISATIRDIEHKHKAALAQHEANALAVAATIVRKMLPQSAEKSAVEEIAGMLERLMESLRSEPRVIVKVNDKLQEIVQQKAEESAKAHGYEGRLIVLGDTNIHPADCRIEWGEGGAERKFSDLWKHIDEILERNLTQEATQADNGQELEDDFDQTVEDPLPPT